MENDEKSYDLICNSISRETTKLDHLENEFKQYLTVVKNSSNDKSTNNSYNDHESSKPASINTRLESYQAKIDKIRASQPLAPKHGHGDNNCKMGEILIQDSNIDELVQSISEIPQKMHNTFEIQRKMVNKLWEPALANVDWKFDYFYDWKNRGKEKGMHGIYDNGKTVICKHDLYCQCFYRVSFGMKPNSGLYKIKIKINNVNNETRPGNIIGITSNTNETNNSQTKHNYWACSYDYIGWSSLDTNSNINFQNDPNVPNGLVCGGNDNYQPQNIFVLSKYSYVSNNNWYKKQLPFIKSGDIVEMVYDSDNLELSFGKSNDQLLDSKIINVPKNQTFYWMVGHRYKPLSMTIVQ